MLPREASPFRFVAILSDIHGNIDALDAVLEDIAGWECEAIFCLGDVIGYGPEPAACVQRMMDAGAVGVCGNHEAMLLVADEIPLTRWRPTIERPLRIAREQLSEAQLDWIEHLPPDRRLASLDLSHASLSRPEYFQYVHEAEEAVDHFSAQPGFISFQGHTHVPGTWESRAGDVRFCAPLEIAVRLNPVHRYAVNVGSVGQPRDGDPRACYALYDPVERVLMHRRLDYDIERAVGRFKRAQLPAFNHERLAVGE